MKQRRIVSAAIRGADGKVFASPRHYDGFTFSFFGVAVDTDAMTNWTHRSGPDQGFIDNNGVYLMRDEAWIVAEAAGQILYRGPGFDGPKLFSENLY